MSDEAARPSVELQNLYNVVNYIGTGAVKIGYSPMLKGVLSREQAINLAAWLAAAAYTTNEELSPVLDAARATFIDQATLLNPPKPKSEKVSLTIVPDSKTSNVQNAKPTQEQIDAARKILEAAGAT